MKIETPAGFVYLWWCIPPTPLLSNIKSLICKSKQLVNMNKNINTYSFWKKENLKKGQCYVQPDFSKRGQSHQSDSKMMKIPFRIFYIQTAHLLFSKFPSVSKSGVFFLSKMRSFYSSIHACCLLCLLVDIQH